MIRTVRVHFTAFLVTIACSICGCGGGSARLTELQHVKSGTLDIVLLSDHDALRHGKDRFVIEFRAAGGGLVDVGTVRASANMPMSGMPMIGSVDVKKGDVAGRYQAEGDLSMAGTWRMTLEWDGPQGHGAVTFPSTAQ